MHYKQIIRLLCICSLPILAWSQDGADLLNRPLTIQIEGDPPEAALRKIEQQAKISFVYNPDLLKGSAPAINLDLKERPLQEALRQIITGRPFKMEVNQNRIFLIETQKPPAPAPSFPIRGYIRDSGTREALIGATILVEENPAIGVATNSYGFFSLRLPEGTYTLRCDYIGYAPLRFPIRVNAQTEQLEILLQEAGHHLEEVVVTAESVSSDRSRDHAGITTIDVAALKTLPAIGGEPDPIKMVQLLPGVKSVGEGSSGLYVRGGNIDQNLILLDEAPVYNPAHLLGFFSVFNPDAIRHMQLHKTAFPIQHGGRLSSVLDIYLKEGNKEAFHLEGGIGLIASRLHLEGPIKEGTASYMVSARRTYPDLVFLFTPDDGGNRLNFYDLNAKVNWKLGEQDHLYLSAYRGRDLFRFFDAYENRWGNQTATLRWNHLFNASFFSNISLIYSDYDYLVDNFIEGTETFNWQSGIEDLNAKADFSWFASPFHTLRFGGNVVHHRIDPGSESRGLLPAVPTRKALETTVYGGHEWKISEQLQLTYGLRWTRFDNLGPATELVLDPENQLVGREEQKSGSYHQLNGLAPRVNLQYQPGPTTTFNLNYNRSLQFLQEVRNSVSSFSAFYTWLPSGPNIPMQAADQFSLGLVKKDRQNNWSFSLEAYYKQLSGQVDFVDHARLIQNPDIEAELRNGKGKAYGIEALLEKQTGALTGRLGYSYARTLRTIPGINGGAQYPAYYDIPHELELLVQYRRPSSRWQFAASWQYATGRAANLPQGSFRIGDSIIPLYNGRNADRLDDFHRLDLSATLYRKEKPDRKNQSYWVFSVYNAYYRKNPLSVDLLPWRDSSTGNIPDPTDIRAFRTYIFGAIPSISYNFKF